MMQNELQRQWLRREKVGACACVCGGVRIVHEVMWETVLQIIRIQFCRTCVFNR